MDVEIALDTEPRVVTVPGDFAAAMTRNVKVKKHFEGLSYSKKKALVDGLELLIAGLKPTYTIETRIGIPQQWERFVAKADRIPEQRGKTFYVVCWNANPDCSFDYARRFQSKGLPPPDSVVPDANRFLQLVWSQAGVIHDVDDTCQADYGVYYTQRNPHTAQSRA